jgi:hypothetical protein
MIVDTALSEPETVSDACQSAAYASDSDEVAADRREHPLLETSQTFILSLREMSLEPGKGDHGCSHALRA